MWQGFAGAFVTWFLTRGTSDRPAFVERSTRVLHKPGVTSLQRREKCICMIWSPGARLQNLPVTNHRGRAGAGMALGDDLGRGGRVKTTPVMESRAEPSRGSCGSVIATLCDVAMAARAVPAWFPDVRAGRGCRQAQSCPTCLGSSGVRWQAAAMGGSLCGRREALSSVSSPSLPSQQIRERAVILAGL